MLIAWKLAFVVVREVNLKPYNWGQRAQSCTIRCLITVFRHNITVIICGSLQFTNNFGQISSKFIYITIGGQSGKESRP